MIKSLLIPKKIILKPVLSWSVDDRHDLRVFLRRFRVRLRFAQKLKKEPRVAAKFVELQSLTKDLLNSCGRVRDLDVARKNLHAKAWLTRSLQQDFSKRQICANRKLGHHWPIAKRRKVLEDICWFMTYSRLRGLMTEKKVTRAVHKLVDRVQKSHPKSKSQWHKLRRLVRRANYLNEILGRRDEALVQFQKTLGDWHDLELYPPHIGHKKKIAIINKKLQDKNKKALKRLRSC